MANANAAGFVKKPLRNIKTLGENLREHREETRMSLEKISRLINVDVKYLEALEMSDFKNLPQGAYAQNFLKKYAVFLGLNPETATTRFKKEQTIFERTQKKKEKINRAKKFLHTLVSPTFLRGAFLVLMTLGILIYLGLKIYNVTKPPFLEINNMADQFSTREESVTFSGQSENEAIIKVNDRQIVSNKDGKFLITLDLQKGLNIVKISAKTKHSRENVLYYQILKTE